MPNYNSTMCGGFSGDYIAPMCGVAARQHFEGVA
jgi:hypothetical protein